MLQALHFFVAYYILNTVLFKHAVSILQKTDHQRDELRQAIINKHRIIRGLQESKRAQWAQFQRILFNQQPPIIAAEYVPVQAKPGVPQITIANTALKDLIHDLKTAIVRKIVHDT